MSFYYHNQTVEFNVIKSKIPSRKDFIDKELNEQISYDIKNKKPLYFLGNDVKENAPFRDFEIVLSGILPCGSKTTVTIVNISPYVDVAISKEFSKSYKVLSKAMAEKSITYNTIVLVKGKKLIGFSENTDQEFARIKFSSISMRKKFIETFMNKYEMFNCDTSCYYRTVSREYHINLSSWNLLKKYKLDSNSIYKGAYNFIVNVKDIEGIEEIPDEISINEIIYSNDILRKDKSMLMTFDIEMYSPILGRVPNGDYESDELFMIGMTLHNTNADGSLINIIITNKYNNPDPEFLTIVCPSEKEVLIMFGKLLSSLQPDFVTEFNGGDYDWPAIFKKLEQHNILKDFREMVCLYTCTEYDLKIDNISKWIFKGERVKIGAGTTLYPFTYRDFGFIMFDTRVIFRSLYPKIEKTKLNSFLEINNLQTKDDLSIPTMFKYYVNGDKEEMRIVAHYCFIDCFSLHSLNKKRTVLQDKREVARLSYTSLFDSFYRADSMRVTNLIVSTCLENNVFSSTLIKKDKKDKKDDEEDEETKKVKFPGAFVLEPKLGAIKSTLSIYEYLKKHKHIDDSVERINEFYYLVINTLYDYIYTVYSCKIVSQKVCGDELSIKFISEDDEYTQTINISNIELFVDYTKEETINLIIKHINDYSYYVSTNKLQYPISALDFSGLYPSLIMTYNISPDALIEDEESMLIYKEKGYEILDIDFMMMDNITRIKAWIVRGKRDENNNLNYYFGLYPTVLKRLSDMRKKVKKIFIPIKDRKEELEKEENYGQEYQDLMFEYNYYNSKQLGIKVFMNTFYGVLGTVISPLFKLPLAGCVTTNGRRSLLLMKNYIETEFKTNVYYGDSVIGKTPLVLKINGKIVVKYMDELYRLYEKYEFYVISSGKYIVDSSRFDIFIMTDNSWSKVNKLIKHKTQKQIYKVTTNNGIVSVTKDHSLLNENKQAIKPCDINGNTKLLCWKTIKSNKNKLDNVESLLKYYFYKNGKYDNNRLVLKVDDKIIASGILDLLNKDYPSLKFEMLIFENEFVIYNKKYNLAILKHLIDYLNEFVLALLGRLVIFDSIIVNNKIVFSNRIKHTYVKNFDLYNMIENSKLNDEAINSNYEIVDEIKYPLFDNMFYQMDYQIIKLIIDEFDVFNKIYKSKLQVQSIIVLLKLINRSYSIKELADGTIKLIPSNLIVSSSLVKHVSYEQSNRYVYDVETTNSHFAAGLGQLVVHNTDSLYFSCDKEEFKEYDKEYYLGKIDKLEYSTKLVEKTFKLTAHVNHYVNEKLFQDNGQRYLTMSYEEVLFPCVWLCKKKYFGVPHEKIINFKPKKLFIKGLDTVKQGASKALVKTCNKVLFDITNIYDTNTMRELVEKYIDYIFTNKWEVSDFIKTAKYDPTKNNVPVQKFVKRMKELNKEVPVPYDRFSFVITKKYPYIYDVKGRQTKLQNGDKMEYAKEVEDNGMEIDLTYYFNGELVGQFAKYILYDDEFHIYNGDELNEPASLEKSKKYIEKITEKYLSGYSNKGKIFKDLYRNVSKMIKSDYKDNSFNITKLSSDILNDDAMIKKHVNASIKKKYNISKISSSIIQDLEKNKIDIYEMKRLYNTQNDSYYRNTLKSIHENILDKMKNIKDYVNKNKSCNKYLNKNELIINEAVEKIKNEYKFENILISNIEKLEEVIQIDDIKKYIDNNVEKEIEIEETDIENIKEFEDLYNELVEANVLYNVHEEINNIIIMKIKNNINLKLF